MFCSKVFHVRSVTQGDVIRADSKDIPRIFQLLYAGEGEARKSDESMNVLDVSSIRGDDKQPPPIMHKGHEFLLISYHMPTNCEVCAKPLWHMFKPPPALECRRKYLINKAITICLASIVCYYLCFELKLFSSRFVFSSFVPLSLLCRQRQHCSVIFLSFGILCLIYFIVVFIYLC